VAAKATGCAVQEGREKREEAKLSAGGDGGKKKKHG
jgi:hypothetical protein